MRGEVRFRKWEHRLRPWDFAAFLHEKRRDFCGRQWLFDEIDAWRASSPERVLLITGDPGVGKSAIVAELVHRNPGEQVLAYHCCQADTKETLRPGRFVRSLAAMIASQLEGYAAQLDDPAVEAALSEARCAQDPASAFEEGILTPLERLAAPADGVRYILVDALDEALTLGEGLTIVDVLAARRERLPGWLRLVATTRKEPAVLDRLRGLRAQELDAQDPRNLDDLDAYLALRLGQPNLAERLAQGPSRGWRRRPHPPREERGQFPLGPAGTPGYRARPVRLRPARRASPGARFACTSASSSGSSPTSPISSRPAAFSKSSWRRRSP